MGTESSCRAGEWSGTAFAAQSQPSSSLRVFLQGRGVVWVGWRRFCCTVLAIFRSSSVLLGNIGSILTKMGNTQSKSAERGDGTTPEHKQNDRGRIPIVEEVFVQRIAFRCGVSDEELDRKKKAYLDHLKEDPTLGFSEFKSLYKELDAGRKDDDFLDQYVHAIFRAFDADKDDRLSFKEWQVGFYLLILLPKDQDMSEVNREDFLLAMEVIFRLYDEDGNAKVTKKEVERIHRLLAEPTVCERLGQCVEAVGKQVDTIDLDRYEGGINKEQFLRHFNDILEENQSAKC